MQLTIKRAELIEVSLVRATWDRKSAAASDVLKTMLTSELAERLEGVEAADIYDALVSVVDEFNEIMSGATNAH